MQQITVNNNEKKGKLAQMSCFLLYFLWLSLLIASFSFAQTHIVHVHGNVTESTDRPLPGANITFFYPDSRDSVKTYSDSFGNYSIQLQFSRTGTNETELPMPGSFELFQNYPNPFHHQTEIPIRLSEPGQIKVTIYNTKGQVVKTVVNDIYPIGMYFLRWDGNNSLGEPVSSGVYFYCLETKDYTAVKKMLYIESSDIKTDHSRKSFQSSLAKYKIDDDWKVMVVANKAGFKQFESYMDIKSTDTNLEKNILLNYATFLPLAVGNSWSYELYLLAYPDKKDTTSYTIIDKRKIGDLEYYVFDKWPIFIPLIIHYSEKNLALFRNNDKGDVFARIADRDALVYEFSNQMLDSMRVTHIDSMEYYPDGLDIVTFLNSTGDTVQTPIGIFNDCFVFAGCIGQVVDSGITAWFSPGIGAVKTLTSNVETEFQLVKFYLR